MRLGTENRKQVYALLSLSALLIVIAAWEFRGTSSLHAAVASSNPTSRTQASYKGFPGLTAAEPELHLSQIARAESTKYLTSGRNIFSLESEAVVIEAPLAPPRAAEVVAAAPPPAPVAPPIEVKYLGYTRNIGESAYKAVLAHKDESLIALQGDIVFHRYKVVSIQPASVQITDLSYKNTQNLPIIDK